MAMQKLTRSQSAPRGRVVVVLAPPGGGKSHYLDRLARTSARRVARVGVQHGWTFADLCRASLSQLGVEGAGDSESAVAEALRTKGTLLLIDDFERFDDREAALGVLAWAAETFDNSSIVVATTMFPDDLLVRMRLYGQVHEVQGDALNLTAAQVRGLMTDQRVAAEAVRQSGGFPAAVVAHMRSSPDLAELAAESALASALDAQLIGDDRRFVQFAALAGPIDVAELSQLCHEDLRPLFGRLRSRPVPLAVFSPDGVLTLGEPVRRLLLRELRVAAATGKAVGLTAFLTRIADDETRSVRTAITWGDGDWLADQMFRWGAHLALIGQGAVVSEAMATFEEERVAADPRLRITAAVSAAVAGDLARLGAILGAGSTQPIPDIQLPSSHQLNWAGHLEALASAPWLLLARAQAVQKAVAIQDWAEAEAMLAGIAPYVRPYPLFHAVHAASLGRVLLHTGREAAGRLLLADTLARVQQNGLSDHPLLLCLDSAIAEDACMASDVRRAQVHLSAGQAKLKRLTIGFGNTQVAESLTLGHVALLLGQVESAAWFLSVAEAAASTFDVDAMSPAALDRFRLRVESLRAGSVEWLTRQEMRILKELDTQATIPEIAKHLFLSVATVRTHVHSIHRKLRSHDRIGTIERAYAFGILP